jgi:electron transport complex protein RnfB
MNTEIEIYRDLQKHLDKLPIGYPATKSGVEIRILKHLFTPEEAEIATQLSVVAEPIERIHKRIKKSGLSITKLRAILERMFEKGTIEISRKNEEKLYGNAFFVVGMYEYQLERLTKDFSKDFLQYLDEGFRDEFTRTKVNQLRTIPVEKSFSPEYLVDSYDNIRQIIADVKSPIAVANCVCRQTKDIIGESCSKTNLRELCLLFGSTAQRFLDMGIARLTDRSEVLNILGKAQEAGLVLQPQNTRQPEFVCCCCGDCCGILTQIKKFPRPKNFFATNHYSEVNSDLCNGCGECVEKCQLEARTLVDGVAIVNLDRCIGCGNCVITCNSGANILRKKEEVAMPPKDVDSLYTKIMSRKIGKWNMLKVGAKILLKLRV